MRISPTGHRVLIKLETVEEKSQGGIILATDREARRQQAGAQFAEVVKIGPLAWADMGEDGEPWARIGDRVITVRYAGAQFCHDQNDPDHLYRIINDDEIIGVVNEEIYPKDVA